MLKKLTYPSSWMSLTKAKAFKAITVELQNQLHNHNSPYRALVPYATYSISKRLLVCMPFKITFFQITK